MSTSATAPRSLVPLVAPVCSAGLATVFAAAISFAGASHSLTVFAGLAAFLGASLLADRFPVPVDDLDANGVSLDKSAWNPYAHTGARGLGDAGDRARPRS